MADYKNPPAEEFVKWLSHPNEFGCEPDQINHIGTYSRKILIEPGAFDVNVFEYVMPDGYRGIGFTNPITWSFMGERIVEIPIEELVTAYCGWAMLFIGLNQGSVTNQHLDDPRCDFFAKAIASNPIHSDFRITDAYQIGDLLFASYSCLWKGLQIQGAWDSQSGQKIFFTKEMPQYEVPAIYFMLGLMQQE